MRAAALVAVLVLATPAAAQVVAAAGAELTLLADLIPDRGRFCLDPGGYVLVVPPGGNALVVPEKRDTEPPVIARLRGEPDASEWSALDVTETKCYRAYIGTGRLRVYRLTVAVDWKPPPPKPEPVRGVPLAQYRRQHKAVNSYLTSFGAMLAGVGALMVAVSNENRVAGVGVLAGGSAMAITGIVWGSTFVITIDDLNADRARDGVNLLGSLSIAPVRGGAAVGGRLSW